MKLLIIRHGDPDYVHDSLTEVGRRQAELLADYLADWKLDYFYVSPLGRAQATAKYTLDRMGRTAETLDWLQEFPAKVRTWEDPELHRACPSSVQEKETHSPRLAWDILPAYWTTRPDYYDPVNWRRTEIALHSDMEQVYDGVAKGLDELLAAHGYVRHGNYYKVEKSNSDTLVFFCHFGLECVLLAHLFHVSPFVLWHSFVATPSAVTLVNTEEREQGVASFRTEYFGDVSHLSRAGKKPSFPGRFCERFEDDTLH